MTRKIVLCLYGLFSAAICVGGYIYGQRIPFAQQWPLYEALRNTASIIFAVVGAWLAIVYPERLKVTFRGGENSKAASGGRLGLVLTPAIHSTFLLVILLLVGIIAPLVKQIPAFTAHTELCRGASFVLLAALTLWQVAIVVMTFYPAEVMQTESDREAAEQQINQQYGKLRQKAGDRQD